VHATTAHEASTRSPWRWVVLAACAPLFMCSQFYRVATAIVAPHLQRDLGLGSEALGALSASFFYGFATAQVPLALVLDRVGARATMAALSLVGAAGAVVFATAHGRTAAIAGEVLLGIGMSGNLMCSLKLVGQWFSPREFATIAGALLGMGTLGNILGTTPLAVLVAGVGWRHALLGIGAATAALAVLFFALVRERAASAAAPPRGEGPPVGAMARTLLGTPDFWLISAAAFCRYGAFASIQGLWAGPWLVEIAGLSPLGAANLILVLNLGLAAGAPLGGWLSDRVVRSRKRLVVASLVGIVVAELALAASSFAPRVWVAAVVLAGLGVASGFGQIAYAHVKDLVPAHMAGMAMTGVNFFVMFGAAAFLHGTGWVLERASGPSGARGPAGYGAAFLAAAVVVALSLALYARTRDTRSGAHERGSS
jgi:sugar phosphate permease